LHLHPRSFAALAALFVLAVSLAACGDDADDASRPTAAGPRALAIEVTGSGSATKLVAPRQAEAGLLEVTFKNSAAKGEHNAALIRVDSDKPLAEVLKAGNAWGDKGKPLPGYLAFHGGTGMVDRGSTSSFVGSFPPGRYLVLDFNNEGEGGELTTELELTGSARAGGLPRTDGVVTARDYGFDAKGLRQGRNNVTWTNAGKEPHHMIAAPMRAGKGKADILKAFNDEDSPPPFDEEQAVEAPIISGGRSQVVELDLKAKGRWALLCFIPDRAGGPPHVAKGMVEIIDVT
jgi:hypothetical protein